MKTGTRVEKCRSQSKKDTRTQCNEGGEQEHLRVDRGFPETRDVGRAEIEQQAGSKMCDAQTRKSSQQRQQKALGESLGDQPAPRGAERFSDGHLTPARFRA